MKNKNIAYYIHIYYICTHTPDKRFDCSAARGCSAGCVRATTHAPLRQAPHSLARPMARKESPNLMKNKKIINQVS